MLTSLCGIGKTSAQTSFSDFSSTELIFAPETEDPTTLFPLLVIDNYPIPEGALSDIVDATPMYVLCLATPESIDNLLQSPDCQIDPDRVYLLTTDLQTGRTDSVFAGIYTVFTTENGENTYVIFRDRPGDLFEDKIYLEPDFFSTSDEDDPFGMMFLPANPIFYFINSDFPPGTNLYEVLLRPIVKYIFPQI